jgi:hypothetical protein
VPCVFARLEALRHAHLNEKSIKVTASAERGTVPSRFVQNIAISADDELIIRKNLIY